MTNRVLWLSLIVIFSFSITNAQTESSELENIDIPNLTLPSPTAYQLGKFGQEKVGLFTGTAQTNISVFTYSTRNLNVPISLNYNSNGIKVDQISTNVGLGWSLSAGGVVSRIARDESDEHNDFFFPEKEIDEVGVMSPMALDFFYDASNDGVDTETDLFTFNFLGHSGKFVIDKNKKIVQIPKSNLLIENASNGTNPGFVFTDGNGVKYYFFEEEITRSRISGSGHSIPELPITTAWYLIRIEHPKGDIVNFEYEGEDYNYIASQSQTMRVPFPDGQYASGNPIQGMHVIPPDPDNPISTHLNHTGKRLIGISSNKSTSGEIRFTYNSVHPDLGFGLVDSIKLRNDSKEVIKSIALDYLFTTNKRVFLEGVQFLDSDNKYHFDYIAPESFPARLSYSQDHWGYYNGENNSYLFPNPSDMPATTPEALAIHDIGANKEPNPAFASIGLLRKIGYPTKGYTQLDYEANDYLGTKVIDLVSTSRSLAVDTESGDIGIYEDTESITASFNQEVEVYASAYFNDSACDEFNDTGKSKGSFHITNEATGENVNLYRKSSQGLVVTIGSGVTFSPDASDHFFARLDEGVDYTFHLTASFECVRTAATVHYFSEPAQQVEDNILTGGLRVKKLTEYDSDGTIASSKRYYYGNKDSLNVSSGRNYVDPYYIQKSVQKVPCSDDGYGSVEEFIYLNLNSNSIRKLYKSSGANSTTYKFVTVSYGGDNFENGGEQHEYKIDPDYRGKYIWGDPIESAPFTNFGWSNGLELENLIFKVDSTGNHIPVKKVENTYKKDERSYDEVKGYMVRKNYEMAYSGDVVYDCTEEDTKKSFEYRTCSTNHQHFYISVQFLGIFQKTCIASGAVNEDVIISHPCYGKTLPHQIIRIWNIDNLDITEYKNLSFWTYLDSSTETIYNTQGQQKTKRVTEFHYDNPTHKLLTRSKKLTSNSDTFIIKKSYPDDIVLVNDLGYDDIQNNEMSAINEMKYSSRHQINNPVQIEKIKKDNTGAILSQIAVRTNYFEDGNSILPKSIQKGKNGDNLENVLEYNNYDSLGNPLELSKTGGAHIVNIWGYNDQYVIAKIQNATTSEVLVALSDEMGVSISSLEDIDETDLDAVNDLRTNSLLPNSQITTYTYKSLIGVTSITDPKGQKTTYHYDNFNRLESIRDENGNILKEYKYNYKQ